MKKLPLLIVILLGTALHTQAQNYQTFNSGRIVSYEDQWNVIKFVRVDSVNFQTDSVLIPFGGFQEISFECYIIDGPSWLGKEIIIESDGWNHFINTEGDTVHINTAAPACETWTAFQRPGQLIITASVSSHALQTFLEIQDSVKTIGFQAYNHLMEPISHPINSMTVALSKNYGLIRTLNFALFPDLISTIGYEEEGLREFEMIGMSDPKAGVQNLTWMEVHDFQPGDEVHTYYYAYLVPAYSTEIKKTIKKYLTREDIADSVSYSIERVMSRWYQNSQGNTFEFTHDTITETFRPDENFDKLPGEIVTTEPSYGAYFYKMDTQWLPAKIEPSIEYWLFHGGDDCWNYLIIDGCTSDYTWYKGLGGPYHYCNLWGEIERSLVYYKKGDETWGDPMIIVGMDENKHEKGTHIYPNPATDRLWINCLDSDLPLNIEFYDLHGRLIKTVIVNETGMQIGLQDFSKGFYSYRIFNKAGLIDFGKVVIQ